MDRHHLGVDDSLGRRPLEWHGLDGSPLVVRTLVDGNLVLGSLVEHQLDERHLEQRPVVGRFVELTDADAGVSLRGG